MDNNLLFVYGTLLLQDNEFGQYLRTNCKYIGDGGVRGRLYDVGEYPALIVDPNAGLVKGRVYEVFGKDALTQIDAYEGVGENEAQPNLYKREIAFCEAPAGMLSVWVYIYNLPVANLQPIPSGDYLEYLNKKNPPVS